MRIRRIRGKIHLRENTKAAFFYCLADKGDISWNQELGSAIARNMSAVRTFSTFSRSQNHTVTHRHVMLSIKQLKHSLLILSSRIKLRVLCVLKGNRVDSGMIIAFQITVK